MLPILQPSNFGNVSRRGGQALRPHGEEAYKGLIYLNGVYKRAIIENQGRVRKNFVGCGKFFECLV